MGPRYPSRRRFSLRPSPTTTRTLAALALGILAFSSSRAGAAEAPPDSTPEPRYKLPPVVVTAERSPLPLDQVPLERSELVFSRGTRRVAAACENFSRQRFDAVDARGEVA